MLIHVPVLVLACSVLTPLVRGLGFNYAVFGAKMGKNCESSTLVIIDKYCYM